MAALLRHGSERNPVFRATETRNLCCKVTVNLQEGVSQFWKFNSCVAQHLTESERQTTERYKFAILYKHPPSQHSVLSFLEVRQLNT